MKQRRNTIRRAPGAALLAALTVAGCATNVAPAPPTEAGTDAALPRPARVLVTDFAVAPDAVTQDQGLGPRLQRQVSGDDPAAARQAIAEDVVRAIGESVVAALDKAGLPAVHAAPGETGRPGDLLVTGNVLRIDEGNRTRRLGIGFGAGKSIVVATAATYQVVPNGPPVLLQSYDGRADSGRKPGLAVGASMAAAEGSPAMGVLSGAQAAGGETRRSPVAREAASFGRRLARAIGGFAAAHGWIAQAAVPAWTR